MGDRLTFRKRFFSWAMVLLSAGTVVVILWNTLLFFNQLKDNEEGKMEIWAAAYKDINRNLDLDSEIAQLSLQILEGNTTTPMIMYNHAEDDYDTRNIPEEKVRKPEQIQKLIRRYVSEYEPINVTHEGEVFSTIYYGNSPTINKLKYYPAAIFLIIILFIALIYFFYLTRRSSEQNKLWAGMARETAHQIGTPLSSLVGWMEILRSEKVPDAHLSEIEKDLDRLQIITDRFSKIGSAPKFEKSDLVEETLRSVAYIRDRGSRLMTFETDTPENPVFSSLNPQLYSWAIENILKNAIDATGGKGTITIAIEERGKVADVLITDTGKGISGGDFRRVFEPGYTTKKRGWGLGLSLSRRIIEDFHRGKIRVKKSEPGVGTTFQITLKSHLV